LHRREVAEQAVIFQAHDAGKKLCGLLLVVGWNYRVIQVYGHRLAPPDLFSWIIVPAHYFFGEPSEALALSQPFRPHTRTTPLSNSPTPHGLQASLRAPPRIPS